MNRRSERAFFVGTYSQPGAYFPRASGEGVVACTLDAESGVIRKRCACPEAVNATYLAASPDGSAGPPFPCGTPVAVLFAPTGA
jgi:hypothetical protein